MRSTFLTARRKLLAEAPSATALTAPAEVPVMMEKGLWARLGNNSAAALSTPTW